MVKMLSPGFPPRRPSGYIRYALVALIIVLLYYTFRDTEPGQLVSYPNTELLPEKPVVDSTKVDTPPPNSNAKPYPNTPLLPEVILPGGKKGKPAAPPEEKALFEDSISNTEGSITDVDDDGSIYKVDPNSKTKSTDSDTKTLDEEDEDDEAETQKTGSKSTFDDDDKEGGETSASKTGSSKSKTDGSKSTLGDDEEANSSSSKTTGSKSKTDGSKSKPEDDDKETLLTDDSKSKTGSSKVASDDDDEEETTKTGDSKSKTGSSKATLEDDEEEEDESATSKSGSSKSKTGSAKSKADDEALELKKPESGDNDESKDAGGSKSASSSFSSDSGPEDGQGHPIDKLIYDAQHNFAEILSKESKTIEQAAQSYRKRRGRHPPPGFDKWFEFASENKAIIVEDFFDQIYHDLEPFWGIPPNRIRKDSWDFEMTIHIRNGNATSGSDWFWTQIWLNLIGTIQHHLPDMDLALNAMDEPRLVVPWEDIDGYMTKAARTRGFPAAEDVITKFQNLTEPGKGDVDVVTPDKAWENTKPYWAIVRRGCAPDSKARQTEMQKTFENPPVINVSNADAHSHEGYVSNFTMSNDPCHQPDLQGLEGIFISPLSVSATKAMFPMFGGSKLTVNNEILLPAPMYWNEEERFTGGDDHGNEWKDKGDKVIWRGVATGGKNKEDNWRGFQRHRFVAMNNGTKVSLVEKGKMEPENFALPDKQYKLQAQTDGVLGEWVDEWADVSFIDLMCDPPGEEGRCNYTDHYFHTTPGLKMADQFDSKYLPDIDGNSFSGRYLGFLRSTSLPIKAALWREWHDSRLVPWKHFVPMDSRFGDFYGIMEYFLGYNGKNGHDRAAEKIAAEGKEWAEQVLRKEDMQIYVLRLLLEYARILDENRANMGWVEDLMKDPALEKQLKTWKL